MDSVEEEHLSSDLPPGFRFHPTDEEIITHYLIKKVMNPRFIARAVGVVDLNKCEPWDLPKKGEMGEKEWYFFCQRDRKYPTGTRTNRATECGYWKATGKDKEIYNKQRLIKQLIIGMKKTLVFYKGRAPKGEKTNWVMHEYRLQPNYINSFPKSPKVDDWVVCRVFHKNTATKTNPMAGLLMRMNSLIPDNDLLDYPSLPPLVDFSNYNVHDLPSSSFTDINEVDHGQDHRHQEDESIRTMATATSSDANNASNLSTFMTMVLQQQQQQQQRRQNSIQYKNSDILPPIRKNNIMTNHHSIPTTRNSFSYPQILPSASSSGWGLTTSTSSTANAYNDHPRRQHQQQHHHDQYSNKVSLSQDTGGGLSTDITTTTEISSAAADIDQQEGGASIFGHDPFSADLDSLWYY